MSMRFVAGDFRFSKKEFTGFQLTGKSCPNGFATFPGRQRGRGAADARTKVTRRASQGPGFRGRVRSDMTYAANSLEARDIATLIHPQTNLERHREVGPVVMTRGRGAYITEAGGKEYLDAAAGLWCASLGFANERLAKAAYESMRSLGYYHLYRHHSHEAAVDLAERLLAIAPVPMSKVLLQCSGSEANDTAIKLVWYYHAAIGKPNKRKIIGRKMGYHGSTAASISASGKAEMHADFGLPFPDFRHTEFPHYYRFHEEGESEESFSARMAEALEKLILTEGPETVGAFIGEPVMGAGGGIVPPRGYWENVQRVLRK